MSEKPLVTIMTPVYNGAEYLDELIQSVLEQDYPNIEHLIIDDGSQDDGATVAVLKKYPHLRWWSRENVGQYATMNEGLDAARGSIICFISADDIVAPSALSLVVQFLESYQKYDGVFGITSHIDRDGEALPNPLPFRLAPMSFIPYFAHISHCSLYIKKEALLQHQLKFDSSFKFVGDYEWMIRINKSKLKIGIIGRELSKVRIHDSQASQVFNQKSSLEKKSILEKYKVNKIYYFILWGINLFVMRIKKIVFLYSNSGGKEVIRRMRRYYSGYLGN